MSKRISMKIRSKIVRINIFRRSEGTSRNRRATMAATAKNNSRIYRLGYSNKKLLSIIKTRNGANNINRIEKKFTKNPSVSALAFLEAAILSGLTII